MGIKKAYLTFDIDCINYNSGNYFDEFELFFQLYQNVLSQLNLCFTIFIRVDSEIEKKFGRPDFFLKHYKNEIGYLREKGNAIGWHFHFDEFLFNSDGQFDTTICNLLIEYSKFAKKFDLKIVRMGFGYHSNETMQLIDKLNFKIDSSCIARPIYPWANPFIDWSTSSNKFYKPSRKDYRITSEDNLNIFEYPITTAEINYKTDTINNVVRYLNPSFKHESFKKGLNNVSDLKNIITVTHPYEIYKSYKTQNYNGIISHCKETFIKNIRLIEKKKYNFCTII